MNLLPIYVLDCLIDLHGNIVRPVAPVQILTGYPDYARLVAYGTDAFDTLKLFGSDGRKTFGVSNIKYRIIVIDPNFSNNTAMQMYEHPFDSAPVVFQDGVMRFREDRKMFDAYEHLEGLPPLAPMYLYLQFIN